jgi:hypothetical protein
MTRPVPATIQRESIVATNPTPQQATPLTVIEQAVNEGTERIPFLDFVSKREWVDRSEIFYITDATFYEDGRFGAEWILTLYPLEGSAVRMSFKNTGGSRDALLAGVAAALPVGPCKLTLRNLAGGKEFFNLSAA